MWEISRIICLAVMTGLSIIDIRMRMIPLNVLIAGTTAALAYQGIWGGDSFWLLAWGGVVGGFFFVISWLTEERIGYGDSWAILALGIYLGLWNVIEVLSAAFFLLFLAGAVCFIKRKKPGTLALPFLPFLTGGYLFLLLTEM